MTKHVEIVNTKFDPKARDLVKKRIDEFSAALILQAKVFSYQERIPSVAEKHVEEALNMLQANRSRSWDKELLMAVGGTFFGAFIPGFINELSTGNSSLIIIYTIMGFLGMFLIFLALIRG